MKISCLRTDLVLAVSNVSRAVSAKASIPALEGVLIKAYNNNGSYYILKDKEKGYAVVGRGFRRVGGWYDTEEEAHQAWRQSR